jgi:threonine/homoserine/homoserine lactone efflux protein
MKIIFNGIQLGIVLAFLVGPVFFSIIQTSVERGFLKGALVALGVSISDILYVIICYFGLVQFVENPSFRIYMAYAGGGTLILFGLYYLIVKTRKLKNIAPEHLEEKRTYRYIMKGFVINGMSPMVLIFWIGTISVASLDFGYSKGIDFFIFFTAVLITVLSTDILKAYLAGKVRKVVTPRSMSVMNIILGIVMIAFGIRLILLSQTIAIS